MGSPALEHVSASQVSTFEGLCERRWAFKALFNEKEPGTQQTEDGKAIHAAVEKYLRTGKIEGEWSKAVEVLIPLLPEPCSDIVIEHRLELPTYAGGTYWLGFIDVAYAVYMDADHYLVISDVKTKSNLNRLKTEEELQTDVQLNSYAVFLLTSDLFPQARRTCVRVKHLYVTRDRKNPKAKAVETTLSLDMIQKRWNQSIETVKKMEAWALKRPQSPLEIPGNTQSCHLYPKDGCFYKSRCFANDLFEIGLGPKENKVESKKLSLRERLGLATAADTTAPATTEVLPPAEVTKNQEEVKPGLTFTVGPAEPFEGAVGVLAPDAPSRETTPEEAEALAPKKGRKKKVDLPNTAIREIPNQATSTHAPALFVGCGPSYPYELASVWMAPILAKIDVEALQYPHMIQDAVHKALQAALPSLPSAIRIDNDHRFAGVFKEVVEPYVKACGGFVVK